MCLTDIITRSSAITLSLSLSLSLSVLYIFVRPTVGPGQSQSGLPSFLQLGLTAPCSQQQPNSSFSSRYSELQSTFSAFYKMVGPSLSSYWLGTDLSSNESAVWQTWSLQLT